LHHFCAITYFVFLNFAFFDFSVCFPYKAIVNGNKNSDSDGFSEKEVTA